MEMLVIPKDLRKNAPRIWHIDILAAKILEETPFRSPLKGT